MRCASSDARKKNERLGDLALLARAATALALILPPLWSLLGVDSSIILARVFA
eukprot:m.6548 g.6548  ORF g.6548 m.6548 type:complete len:53 (-) comp2673_c0_seq1:827-985(-)